MTTLPNKRVLLIVAGGIAAYKTLEVIRRLRDWGVGVRCVLTAAGAEFVTPLSLAALSGDKVYRDLFSLTDESEMGHIRLSRETDLIVVAPATADVIARAAAGLANDLATTVLLASDKPVMMAPAMNVWMWRHPATQTNVATLRARGVAMIGPNDGDMACGEWGPGRMAEPEEILAAILARLRDQGPLAGRRALVTSGPTREPIDPVRFLSNHSSGRQGHAIAAALAAAGAETHLVTGPTDQPDPPGVAIERIETAEEMLAACRARLPVDVVVCAAAVSDWRIAAPAGEKLKKQATKGPPVLTLRENPDILATLAVPGAARPPLVIGFAAETERVIENAVQKRTKKGCDWIVANDVSPAAGTFGGDRNTVHLVTDQGIEDWPEMRKEEVASRLVARIAQFFQSSS